MESLFKKHHPELYAKIQKEEGNPQPKKAKVYNKKTIEKIEGGQDSDTYEDDVETTKGTYVKNGVLYDNGVAIDYCDSDRDYDY